MATIRLDFDNNYKVSQPTLVLATRHGDKLGAINTVDDVVVTDNFSAASEFSATVYKTLDGVECNNWDDIQSLRLAWVKDWDRWFEINVNLEDSDTIHKPITATSLSCAELSQIYVNSTEINTEDDIAREEYERPTVLYDKDHPEASLLHRVLEKAPHYTVSHVDYSIADIQRTFSWDGTSIYDVLSDIAEEIGCIFVFPDGSNEDNLPARTIEVYDLKRYCLDCTHRFDDDGDCPECGSSNIKDGYGDDTTIIVTSDVLADSVTIDVDEGSCKTCMKMVAGDDLMTAAIIACNPNGSQYLWRLTDIDFEDMSDELSKKINSYNELYTERYTTHEYPISITVTSRYNNLINKYSRNGEHPTLPSSVVGYPAVLEAYYNVIDFGFYLSDGMMPDIDVPTTTAADEVAKCTTANLSPIALSSVSTGTSQYTSESAIKAAVTRTIYSGYDITINTTSFVNNYPDSYPVWTGTVSLVSNTDEEDAATSSTIIIQITDDYDTYLKQSIDKVLADEESDNVGVVALFAKDLESFETALSYYALSELESLLNICKGCTDVLITQGAADTNSNAYSIYESYFAKENAIQAELDKRADEVDFINGTGKYTIDGVKLYFESAQNLVHKVLDFESYIGDDALLAELSAFRREDTYQNDNYISDGLTNAELVTKAQEFIAAATSELAKASTIQNSVSASLHNLLAIPEFAPLVDSFQVGNWIRVRADETIYKLRLVSYTLKFNNIQELEVEFSEAEICPSGMNDIKSVVDQMQSVTTSYNYTQRQASKAATASAAWNTMLDRGLDMTQTKILNNPNTQDQVIDEHGILLREYDPYYDEYAGEQMRLINSTIAITDDAWKSVKTAVGKFYYADPDTGEMVSAYGINGEVIAGKLVLGNQLGIYNENGSLKFNENGLEINIVQDNDGNYASPFSISRDGVPQFYIDQYGVLRITSVDNLSSQVAETQASAVVGVATEYYLSTSQTELIDGKWTSDIPEWIDGSYYWTRDVVTYGNGTTSSFDPICITGNSGSDGADGVNNYMYIRYSDDGKTFTSNDGVTVGDWMGSCVTDSSTAPTNFDAYTWYKVKGEPGTDGLDGKDGMPGKDGESGLTTYFHVKYSPVLPAVASTMTETPSKYIGTYVDYTEADSTDPAKYNWVQFMGTDGKDGIPGINGEDGKTYYLHIKYSNDGGSTFTSSGGETSGEYIGVYTDTNESDSTNPSNYTWSKIKGADGKDGTTYYTWIKYADTPTSGISDDPDGKTYIGLAYNKTSKTESQNYSDYTWSLIKGSDGLDGINGSDGADGKTYYTWVKYADDESGKNMTNDPTNKKYIGLAYNKDTPTESNVAGDYTWALFRGADGVNGTDGKDGRGISSTAITYQSSSSGTTIPSTWSTNIPSVSAGNYLWTRTIITYTDSSTSTSYSVSRAGKDGTNGENGADGKGVQSITNYYLATAASSGVTRSTTGWTSGVQTITSENPYLWNYETTVYTNGDTEYTSPTIIGTYGRDGQNGKDGRGIESITEYYLVSSLSANVTTSTSGWGTSIVNTDATKKYLWNYEEITYTEGSPVKTTPRIIGTHGDTGAQGPAGTSAVTYVVESSVDTVYRDMSNNLTPSKVTFKFYSMTGNSTVRNDYSGRYVIETSSDGVSWTNKVSASSSTIVSSYTYPLSIDSSGTMSYIRCTLYATGNTDKALSQKIVSVTFDSDTFKTLLAIENNTTVIDGSKILTESIFADKINITDLSAFKAKIGGWEIDESLIYKESEDSDGKTTGIELNSFIPQIYVYKVLDSVNKKYNQLFIRDGMLEMAQYTTSGGELRNFSFTGGQIRVADIEKSTGSVLKQTYIDAYDSSFARDVAIGGNATINGATALSKTLTVTGKITTDATMQSNAVTTKSIELVPNTTSSHGGYIDFHFAGSATDYTSRLWENESGKLTVTGKLAVQDTISTSSTLTVSSNATVGGYLTINGTNAQIIHTLASGSMRQMVGNSRDSWYLAYYNSSGTWVSNIIRAQTDGTVTIPKGVTSSSDERLKTDWTNLDKYDGFFDNLNPIGYRYVDGDEKHHIGFGAQSVERALTDTGLTNDDFAGLVKTQVPLANDEWRGYDDEYGLTYTEFIALNTYQIQKLKQRNTALESRVADLETKLEQLLGGLE